MRILIVEDEILLAMMLEEWLQEAGHETLGPVRSMREAIDTATAACPDLALMDVNLGASESGVDIARILKKDWNIPSLYLTAYRDVAETSETGVGILNKPVTQTQLIKRIAAIEQKRSQDS